MAKLQGPAGACTGPLVAPLWVVTAKSCVPHDTNGVTARPRRSGVAPTAVIRTVPRCMGAAGDRVANETLIEIFDCLGSTGQKWLPRDDGSILNPASGRCLDLRFADTTDFARMRLHDCNERSRRSGSSSSRTSGTATHESGPGLLARPGPVLLRSGSEVVQQVVGAR